MQLFLFCYLIKDNFFNKIESLILYIMLVDECSNFVLNMRNIININDPHFLHISLTIYMNLNYKLLF